MSENQPAKSSAAPKRHIRRARKKKKASNADPLNDSSTSSRTSTASSASKSSAASSSSLAGNPRARDKQNKTEDLTDFIEDLAKLNFLNNESAIHQTPSGRQITYLTDRARIRAEAELLADIAPFRMPYS